LALDDINDLFPHDVHSPESLDDLLTTIGTHGIDVLEGQPKLPTSALNNKLENEVEASDEVELDLTLTALEKTNDPVRIYLRKMGTVPLLTRQGEVDIAKRIERGQLRVLKALSRSPIVIHEILAIGEDLKLGVRSITGIVVFDEEEMTGHPAEPRQGHRAPHRQAAEALQKSQPASRTTTDHPSKEESTRIPPLPMWPGPRDRSAFADHPQLRFHELRAQTPSRSGE